MSSIKEEMNGRMDDTEPIVTKVKLKGYRKMMKQLDRLIRKAEELNETLERTDKLLKRLT